jgi:hypothetical protein
MWDCWDAWSENVFDSNTRMKATVTLYVFLATVSVWTCSMYSRS